MDNKKYYITTAIAYTSSKPHIGNVYEIVLADAIARYKRLTGHDVWFQTGTDEHGQKIEEKAIAAKIEPKAYTDMIMKIIKEQFDIMNISYDHFIRTTDEYHVLQVQKIFKKLYEQGDIYKGEYNGLYCKACEAFYTESQLIDGKCPECHLDVVSAKEEAYFLKITKYEKRLSDYIEANLDFIQPASRKNEMVNNFIKPGLQDLCVSRTSFKWGVPVDFDENHVVYVWIDALSNYITGLGYDVDLNHGELYKKYWPADLHLIGKDILRFHTIYWPVILMALDVPLPKLIFGHPWLLLADGKMSKSVGNVIYADELAELFGVDQVRYVMLHDMPYQQDGKFSYEAMMDTINSDLANVLGNLVNRTIAMGGKYFNYLVTNPKVSGEFDDELINYALNTVKIVEEKMADLRVADALEAIIDLARRSNKYIDETCPWILAKEEVNHPRLNTVLYNLYEAIRFVGVLIKPFIPESAEKILTYLNTKEVSYESILSFGNLEVDINLSSESKKLFERLDQEEILKNLEAKNQEPEEEFKSEITYQDFEKLDLVVGEVLECVKHPNADKLLVFKIAVRKHVRTIVSGIAEYYNPADLVGKKVVFVANLAPRKVRGIESHGMILSALDENGLEVVSVDKASGSRVL